MLEILRPLWSRAVDEGVPRRSCLPQATLKDCILATVARRQDDAHVIYRGSTFTFAETNELACRLANALLSVGVSRGDCVCIMLRDTPELIVSYMACYKIGAVAVGINPRCTADEVVYISEKCLPEMLIVSRSCVATAQKANRRLGHPFEDVVIVEQDGESATLVGCADIQPADYDRFDDAEYAFDFGCPTQIFTDFVMGATDDEPPTEVMPSDTATLIFTGGTTGAPKACPLTHSILIWAQYFFYSMMRPLLRSERDMTTLLTSPMTHAYGLNFGVNWGAVIGATVVIASELDGHAIAELIDRYQVKVWGAVPALINAVALSERAEAIDLSSLKVVVVSCTASSARVIDRFKNVCDAAIVEDYGMSETGGPVTLTPVLKGATAGSVGVPVANTDVLVVDSEEGDKPLGLGEQGEVIFRGPQVIDGYVDDSAETKHAFRNGWIYSGDIGYFDENGYLTISGRKKDMINVSGFNVFPREVDEVIQRHPFVVDACTVGVPDEKSGERPKSYVVLRKGANLDAADLISYCHEHLIAYKCPKYVEFLDEIPLTPMGKPNVRELKRRFDSSDAPSDSK